MVLLAWRDTPRFASYPNITIWNMDFVQKYVNFDTCIQWLESRNVPILYCYSRLLLPRPADWGPNAHVIGPLLPPARQQSVSFAPGESFTSLLRIE